MSSPGPLHRLATQRSPLYHNTTFWWAIHTQTQHVPFAPARTHYLGLKVQNFEKPISTFECFSLKAVYNSHKLQRINRFCLCTTLLKLTCLSFRAFRYCYWNHHLHNSLLPDKVIHWWFFIFQEQILRICHLRFEFRCSSYKVFRDIKIFWTVISRW